MADKEKHSLIAIKLMFMITALEFLYISCVFAYSSTLKEAETLETELVEEKITEITRPKVEYTAKELKDPFKRHIQEVKVTGGEETVGASFVPRVERSLASFNLEIQGIIWGGRFPQAIINNQVVKEGDKLKLGGVAGEASITTIDKDGVIFSFEGVQYKLSSPGMKIKLSSEDEGGKANEK